MLEKLGIHNPSFVYLFFDYVLWGYGFEFCEVGDGFIGVSKCMQRTIDLTPISFVPMIMKILDWLKMINQLD